MENKQYYINAYEKVIKIAEEDFIRDNGSLEDFCYSDAEGDYIETVDEIVGHYLYHYGDKALEAWLENTKGLELTKKELSVEKILKEIS